MDMATQAHGDAERNDLEAAPRGIARVGRLRWLPSCGPRPKASHRQDSDAFASARTSGQAAFNGGDDTVADGDDVRKDLDPQVTRRSFARHATDRRSRRRFSRARALEDVAQIVPVVLHSPARSACPGRGRVSASGGVAKGAAPILPSQLS